MMTSGHTKVTDDGQDGIDSTVLVPLFPFPLAILMLALVSILGIGGIIMDGTVGIMDGITDGVMDGITVLEAVDSLIITAHQAGVLVITIPRSTT